MSSLDRLILRQHRDDQICIFSGHVRDVLGVEEPRRLVDLINRGMDKGFLERRPDPGQDPERLDADKHLNWNIGLRLTEKGKRRAEKLESQHATFRPFGAPD